MEGSHFILSNVISPSFFYCVVHDYNYDRHTAVLVVWTAVTETSATRSQFYRHARNLCQATALIPSRRPYLGDRYVDGKSVFDEPASRQKAHARNCASRSWLFLAIEGQYQELSNQKLPLHTPSSAALTRGD